MTHGNISGVKPQEKKNQVQKLDMTTPEARIARLEGITRSLLHCIELLIDVQEMGGVHKARLMHITRKYVAYGRELIDG